MSKRKKTGTTDPYSTQAIATVPARILEPGATTDPQVMQLIQEHLQVEKHWVEAGAITIKKTVETAPVTVPVELAHEELQIQRLPVGRILADGEAVLPRQEGNTLIIPVVEEEIVVLKRRVVREELHITKQRVVERREVSDTVRRERLHFETTDGVEFIGNEGVSHAGEAPGL